MLKKTWTFIIPNKIGYNVTSLEQYIIIMEWNLQKNHKLKWTMYERCKNGSLSSRVIVDISAAYKLDIMVSSYKRMNLLV